MGPLDEVTAAATAFTSGRMNTRLAPTDDPDLVAVVASFNTMVDALAQRIEREAPFTADVSHEQRSPLTTRVTGVELLDARREELTDRSRQALDLVRRDLERFRRSLEDLLQLVRFDAGHGSDADARTETDLRELVRHVLVDSGRDPDSVLTTPPLQRTGFVPAGPPPIVRAIRRQIERAVHNLFANADRHGGGRHAVTVTTNNSSVFQRRGLVHRPPGRTGCPLRHAPPAPSFPGRRRGRRRRGRNIWPPDRNRDGQRAMNLARRRRLAPAAVTLVVLPALLIAGCGVPVDDEARALPTASVPYGLLEARRPGATPSDAAITHGRVAVHVAFVAGEAGIRLVDRTVEVGPPLDVAQALLDQLQAGPTAPERRRGLGSTLQVTGGLRLAGITDGVAAVEILGEGPRQVPDRLPLTVAQVVFTMASVPGVDAVVLRRAGQPVDAPLPDGSLTSVPLTPRDYRQLLNRAPDPR